MTQEEQAQHLRALHHGPEILVLPNVWDAGTAMLASRAGFKAIATTSSGIEFSARLSNNLSERCDQTIAALRPILNAVEIPVTADIESGYGVDAEAVAASVTRFIEAGVAGINIEDTRNGSEVALRAQQELELYPIDEAVERIVAARQAAERSGVGIVINGRTDVFMSGKGGAEAIVESVKRCNAFLAAGADCVFVPYANDAETIEALVQGIAGPLNVLGGPQSLSVAELQALGIARVSVGGSVARAAMGLVQRAFDELRERGTYSYAAQAMAYEETLELLR